MRIFPLVVLMLLSALSRRAAIACPHGSGWFGTTEAIPGHSTPDMTPHDARIAGVARTDAHAVADPARRPKTCV